MVLLDLSDLAAPGWVPLAITGILAVACVLLALNMRKQIRRIEVPVDEERVDSPPFADPRQAPELIAHPVAAEPATGDAVSTDPQR